MGEIGHKSDFIQLMSKIRPRNQELYIYKLILDDFHSIIEGINMNSCFANSCLLQHIIEQNGNTTINQK